MIVTLPGLFSYLFFVDKIDIQIFFVLYFFRKHVVGTHLKCLGKTFLMSIHNISFCAEIIKISILAIT